MRRRPRVDQELNRLVQVAMRACFVGRTSPTIATPPGGGLATRIMRAANELTIHTVSILFSTEDRFTQHGFMADQWFFVARTRRP